MLADQEKLELCETLLDEFGVTNRHVRSNGEIIHSCPLPFGGHSNGDTNPSASLNYRKLTFNCLGCANSGGLLWFIAACRDTTSSAARSWLRERTGLDGEEGLATLLKFFDALYADRAVDEPLPRLNTKLLDPWMWIHPYLTELRHIPEQTIEEFKVGWDPAIDRIVVPHFWRGSLVGWQTRQLGGPGPKYHNSPDFPKDRTIYNYDTKARPVVVCESTLSVLSKAHLPWHIESTFGAEVTDKQVGLLTMHPDLILFFDNDDAGWKATHRVAEATQGYSHVLVANNPYAADPGDLDEAAYATAVESAVPYALWTQPTTLVEWKRPEEDDDQEVRSGRDLAGAGRRGGGDADDLGGAQ
jgi:hypothetical protein